jgi:hypothetical protein
MKSPRSPRFSDEEQSQIITELLALKKSIIAVFLQRHHLATPGRKDVLRLRIEDQIHNGKLTIEQVLQYLDEVVPWGKQHVFLYQGPQNLNPNWRNESWVDKLLKSHRLKTLLNQKRSLALPAALTISEIAHSEQRLRIVAIRKREWRERCEEYDDSTQTPDGEAVELRAFLHRITRSMVSFEWDFLANTAFLQIAQLPSGLDYDEVADEFKNLIRKWLNLDSFSPVDLRRAIKNLHALEDDGNGEATAHVVNYRLLTGRRFEARSASSADPLVGEASMDIALREIRNSGVGHLGNLYWLPKDCGNGVVNPLTDKIHVILVGERKRVNFPTPNTEADVRYVLSRIRSHCS